MRTPDQIRLQLERIVESGDACNGCLSLIALLRAVLPEVVDPAWCAVCRMTITGDRMEHIESPVHLQHLVADVLANPGKYPKIEQAARERMGSPAP